MTSAGGKKAHKSNLILSNDLLQSGLLLIAGLVALVVLRLAVQALPPEAGQQPYLGVWLRLWVFAVLATAAISITRLKDVRLRNNLLAVMVGLCLAFIVLLGLKNTSYGLNGISGDQGFSTAQVTKFAELPGNVDFAYKDLPAFYPPLYFYILGKGAAIIGLDPYKTLKYGLLLVVFMLPLLSLKFWERIKLGAMPLAVVLSFFLFQDWYKPYEWITLVLFVPWWLYFVEGVGRENQPRNWVHILIGSVVGALLFSTYYYWFFIGGVSLVLRLFVRNASWSEARDQQTPSWINRSLILGGSALLSLPYWGALVASMWRTGGWVMLQNRYFLPQFSTLNFPFLEASLSGLLMLGGLVYLLLSFRRSRVSFGLLALLVAAYAWLLFGYVAFLLDSPLLSIKTDQFINYVLILAALFGAAEVMEKLRGDAGLRKKWGSLALGGAVVAGLFFGQSTATSFADSELLQPALNTDYPQAMISGYKDLTAGQYAGHVVLADSNFSPLSVYLPVYQFVSWAAVYSHPAGLFEQRIDFLEQLSQTQDPAWFAAALMNNRFDHIDEIILIPIEDGYYLSYLPDNFPQRNEAERILFNPDQFSPEYFSSVSLNGSVALIPNYANNPLGQLPPATEFTPDFTIPGFGDGDDLHNFFLHFASYLDPDLGLYESRLSDAFGS